MSYSGQKELRDFGSFGVAAELHCSQTLLRRGVNHGMRVEAGMTSVEWEGVEEVEGGPQIPSRVRTNRAIDR